MAHLKLYLNGTPGGTDGEELTDSTVIKGIMTNSQAGYQNYGGAIVPVCLRCEAGYRATNVVVRSITNVFCITCSYNNTSYFAINSLELFKTLCENANFGSIGIPSGTTFTVENTNVMILLLVEACNTDTTALTDLFSVSYVEDETA